MKTSIQIFFKKILDFLKVNFRKNPKKSIFILFFSVFFPTSFVFGWLGEAVYSGFLSVILFVTDMFKALSSYLVYASGVLFDNLLTVSIYTDLYNAEWVKLGWALIRDVANIAFILGVIVIGFFMIVGKTQWKKMLGHLLIVAFIMNFSMFFARVVIDAGNFTTAIFYSLSAVKTGKEKETDVKDYLKSEPLTDRWSIAAAILGKKEKWEPYFGNRSIASGLIFFVNPNAIYGEKAFEASLKEKGFTDVDIKKTLIILNIVFIFTMVIMSIALLKGSFNFISRTIHLIKLIIVAPAHFAYYFLPGGGQSLYKWFGDIVGKAFCMVGYMIGIWLLLAFLSTQTLADILKNINDSGQILHLVTILFIKAYLVYKAMNMLTDYSAKQCENGDLGSGIVGTFTKVAGFVGGGAALKVASGAMGMAGGVGSSIVRGRLHNITNSLGERLDSSKYAGADNIAGRFNSWAKTKVDDSKKWKIGRMNLEEDLAQQSSEEAADYRRVERAQGKEAADRMRAGRLDIDVESVIEENKEKRKRVVEWIKEEERVKVEKMKKEGKTDEEIKRYKKEAKNARREKIKELKEQEGVIDGSIGKYILNNYSEVSEKHKKKKGVTKSVMEFLSGTDATVKDVNKEYQTLHNKIAQEEKDINAKLKEANKKYNEAESEESFKHNSRQTDIKAIENSIKDGNKTLDQSLHDMINTLGVRSDFVGADNELLTGELLINKMKSDSRFKSAMSKFDNTGWTKAKEEKDDKTATLKTAESEYLNAKKKSKELIEAEKALAKAEAGGNKAKIAATKVALIKAEKKFKDNLIDAEDGFKKAQKELNESKTALEKENQKLSEVFKTGIKISEDVKKSVLTEAKGELETKREKLDREREVAHEHKKEAKESQAKGEYYSRGMDKHNT